MENVESADNSGSRVILKLGGDEKGHGSIKRAFKGAAKRFSSETGVDITIEEGVLEKAERQTLKGTSLVIREVMSNEQVLVAHFNDNETAQAFRDKASQEFTDGPYNFIRVPSLIVAS